MRFRKTLTRVLLAMGLAGALPAWAQQKPFTRDQVQGLVRDGLGDESGAKLIEPRGIDFAPTESLSTGWISAYCLGSALKLTAALARADLVSIPPINSPA